MRFRTTRAPAPRPTAPATLRAAFALLLLLPFPIRPATGGGAPAAAPPARSAVLFIADGMGQAYVTATRLARGRRGRLHLDDLPRTAIVRTWSADSPVTDSAAAASAMACGRKTNNEVVCEDASAEPGKRHGARLESIARWAKRRGLRAGVVTTARVTHATPAAFYATHHDRDAEREIARQAIDSPLDFLLGGGRREFGDLTAGNLEGARGREGETRRPGWRLVTTAGELRGIRALEARVLGLFSESHMPYEAERARGTGRDARTPAVVAEDASPGLVEMVRWALDVLQADGWPFLLVVEAGRPDHAGHDSQARTLVGEMDALDEAVGLAIGRLDPATTLVLVTGDHETGGVAINGYPTWEEGIWGASLYLGVRTPVLTFATGPGTGATRAPGGSGPSGADDLRPSGFVLRDGLHTGVDLPLYAWGAGSEPVRGTLENTAIYHLLRAHFEGKEADRGLLERADP
ncbi:MAG: alkaline phosphatase [Candidatus Polarisedimenticolia bacterium]